MRDPIREAVQWFRDNPRPNDPWQAKVLAILEGWMSEQNTPSWPTNPPPQPIDRVPQAQEPTSGAKTTARSTDNLAQSFAPVSRILAWLGRWRNEMPAEAVDHLHCILDASTNPTSPHRPECQKLRGGPCTCDLGLRDDRIDIAEWFHKANYYVYLELPDSIVCALIECIRDAAMEAECLGEMSGFRVTLLERHGLTDSSDPAFGPVKYPDQGKPKGDPELF